MGKNVLVRNIPSNIENWIDKESSKHLMSRQEFILNTLQAVSEDGYLYRNCDTRYSVPFIPQANIPFKFIDLFAGIGGFRIALEKLGGQCVFSSEWDTFSQKTYHAWFGDTPEGDIRKINPLDIPDHDILAAGFPCQPFSIAGVSKKKSLGRDHGFMDKTQGTLFFNLANIIDQKRPPIVFLENVKNLKSHDKGRTWNVIRETLDTLQYWVYDKVIDAAGWVPQHRERVYIVAFDKNIFMRKPDFCFPLSPGGSQQLKTILETNVASKYTLSDHLWNYLQNYAKRQKEKGNGFGYGIADPNGITRTLSARYYKDGSEILIAQGSSNPRRLTPRECARLMGFGDSCEIVVSDTQAYRQFGNAVVPLVVEAIGEQIIDVIARYFCTNDRCLIKIPCNTQMELDYAGYDL